MKKKISLSIFVPAFGIAVMSVAIVIFAGLNYDALLKRFIYNKNQLTAVLDNALHKKEDPEIPSAPQSPQLPQPRLANSRIRIPAIQVNAPIIWAKSSQEQEMYRALLSGVAHDPRTPRPNEQGNVFMTGHSSGSAIVPQEAKTVFSNLEKLSEHDLIEIMYEDRLYVYEVKEKLKIYPTDVSVLEQTKNSQLTLMTCWPLGTSWKRFIVRAPLKGIYNVAGDLISNTLSEERT